MTEQPYPSPSWLNGEGTNTPEIRIKARNLYPARYPSLRGDREDPSPDIFSSVPFLEQVHPMIYSVLDIDPRYWEITIFDPNNGEHTIVRGRDG